MLQPISYFNTSGVPIPAYGVFQSDGTMTTTATGDYVMNAVKPGKGFGPYFVDDGKGSLGSGDGRFGSCYAANEGVIWVAYTGTAPGAGQPVGPARGSFQVGPTGGGFRFMGIYDVANARVLAIASNQVLKGKTESTAIGGSLTTPAALNVDLWYPDTSSGTVPVPDIVTTNANLLGLSVQNRSNGAILATDLYVRIQWDYDECEWALVWEDCP